MTTRSRLFPQAVLLIIAMGVTGALPVVSKATEPGVAPAGTVSDWQTRRLMQPTPAELTREADGEIVIYEDMTDRQVEAALSAHFGRIPNMMFVGTIVTDERGAPQENTDGGYVVEDGGC